MYGVIDGGVAPRGTIKVSGAKNSATRVLAASLLSDESVTAKNFPTKLVDVNHKVNFCRKLGAIVDVDDTAESVVVCGSNVSSKQLTHADYDVPIRTTYLLAASQILRDGSARIPYPGGCPIGTGADGGRGYDQHILVWQSLGALVTEESDHIRIVAPNGFKGGEVNFQISTVGGTENSLLCSVIANGTTKIFNAYITPEVEDLIRFLRSMGADIEVSGTSHIIVHGNGKPLGSTHMTIMSDRIEALTWLIFSVITKGELTISNIPFQSMEVPLLHLRHAGIDFFHNTKSIHFNPTCLKSGSVQPFDLSCGAHPGIISDMQPFYVLLALKAAGTSRIFDYRYPERIAYTSELAKLLQHDSLQAERGKVVVDGPARFKPGIVNSTDLRGSMAAVLAALCADGRSVINNIQMALRGYNDLEAKLSTIGCRVNILEDDSSEIS